MNDSGILQEASVNLAKLRLLVFFGHVFIFCEDCRRKTSIKLQSKRQSDRTAAAEAAVTTERTAGQNRKRFLVNSSIKQHCQHAQS